ncbi:MAG: hypothetical protein DVB23_001958 [Verrucomicrobia bacterium]|nr:MAG: hypothetical protein DVB23_001958 [Verrucomicrobiota bacterium]
MAGIALWRRLATRSLRNAGYGLLCSLVQEAGGIGNADNQALLTGSFGPLGGVGNALSPPGLVLGKGQRFGSQRIVCQVQFSNTDKEVISLRCNP